MTNDAAIVKPARRSWLWQPNLIVFVSSACIMILELVAGRLIAPHVGSSLYTWTSVIGVVLAGISVGNYLGGRLADRWASLRFLGVIYLLAAFSCLTVLYFDRMDQLVVNDWHIIVKILVLTTAMFFVPCTILGTISPIVAKLSVSDLAKTGRTVGEIYAAGALGSIVGTFLTGFVLISTFGSYTIVFSVALVLAAIGVIFLLVGRWQSAILAIVVVAAGWALASNQGWLKSICVRETNYYCIKIIDQDNEGKQIRQLVLDHLVHSFVELGNPTNLVYGYEKIYAELAQYRSTQNSHQNVLMIGGGGYTFPRYMEAVYPEATVHVVEIDPGVTQFAHDMLGLKPDTKIVTYNEDARMFMAGKPTMKYDLVLGDAFNHYSVPYHLTTKEFNDRVHAWLADDGIYAVNIIDGPRGEFVRAYYNTLRESFKYTYLAEGNSDWRHTARSFFILIGTDKPFEPFAFANFDAGDGDALLARTLAGDTELQKMLTEAPLVELTDQYAPVDQMLASIFTDEEPPK